MGSTQRRPQNSERAVNIESEYDSGSKNGIWRLFRLFNKKTFKYTLCCRKAIEDDPDVGISSVNRHDVASHAYRWIDYAHMTPEKEKAYIKKEIETVQRLGVLLQSGGIMTSIKPISVFDLGILQDMDIPLL
jgi:peptidoglycan/xylan/chitin deacetylase (PgdA/CDA1 family)